MDAFQVLTATTMRLPEVTPLRKVAALVAESLVLWTIAGVDVEIPPPPLPPLETVARSSPAPKIEPSVGHESRTSIEKV